MPEFKPAPTAASETRPGKIPPASTAPEKKAPEKKIHVDITGDPEETLKKLAGVPKEVEFAVVSAKHRIGTDNQEEQEVLEQEGRMTARARMTEDKAQYAGKQEGESSTKFDRLKQSFKQALPRWWKYGVHSLNTYVKEKDQAHKLLAEAGIQMKSLPYEFLRNVRNLAQEGINAANDQSKADRDARREGMNRRERFKDKISSVRSRMNEGQTDDMGRWDRTKNKFRNMAGRNQRELAAREVTIVQNLRKVVDPRFSGDPDVQRFAAENAALVKSYKDVLLGDFQAAEGLARRLGNEFSDEAIRTAVGEKRATDIILTGEKAKPIADFFKNEVIVPMLVEGLANDGKVNPDTLLELRTKVQEKFFTKEFVEWRKSLPPEVQEKFDLSMSYGTDIIPAIEKVLLPQLMAVKDHLQTGANLQEYVDQMVLKVNVGTLQAGEQGSVGETKREAKFARSMTNERVMNLYRTIEQGNGPEPIVPGVYQDALDSASGRLRALGFVGGHNTAGLATGAAIWAAQYGFTKSASLLLPFIGGSVAAGIVRGVQERSRFTREYEQHGREAARGVIFDDEAKRRNEMKKLEMPMIDIQAGVLNPLGQTLDQLRRGQASTDVLNRAFGLLADARVRRSIMDENTNIELYRTTTDQSLDAQKTELELRRAQTMAELRKLAADNPAAIRTYARTLGIDFNAGDNIDKILNPLEGSLRANIQQGAEIENQFQNTLTTGVDSESNINKRERAMQNARVVAQLKQGAGTTAAALVGGGLSYILTEEVATLSLRAWEHTLGDGTQVQPSFIEKNLFGMEDAQRVVEGFTTTGKHSADIFGHRVNIPDGTHWVSDNGKFDLVMDARPDQVIIDNAYFEGDTLKFDQATSLIKPEGNITVTSETKNIDIPVTGENGIWNKFSTPTDHREYYGYNTRESNLNELRGHTIKEGNSIIIQAQNMGVSSQDGLIPPHLNVQDIIKSEVGIALTLPGDLNNPIIVKPNNFTTDGDGQVWASLRLNPDAAPTETVTFADGKTMPLAAFSRAILNEEAYMHLKDGDIATEMKIKRPGDTGPARQLREVFNLGGPDGTGRGHISIGRLVPGENGEKPVWQSFATMFGTGRTADIEFPTEIPVTEITVNIEGSEDPWDPFGIPIPAPWPRRPLEAGERSESGPLAFVPIEYRDYTDYLNEYGEYAEPTEYTEFDVHGEYNEYGEYTESRVAKKRDKLQLVEDGDKRAETEAATPEALVKERVKVQHDYIDSLRSKYQLDNANPQIQQMLYRLNGRTMGYVEELEEVNAGLPPMSDKAKLSVVIPAFNEQGKVEQTLEGWAKQIQEANSNKVDPENIELIMLLNRPNGDVSFDGTESLIERLKGDPRFNGLTIHVVKKTFNFPDTEEVITGPDDSTVRVAPGKKMGLIYKYGADLAILRNIGRDDELRVANHLLRTGGADTAGRNPEFISRVFGWFDANPYLEQYTSRSDYPPAVYEKLPLLHIAHRLNQMMNYQMTQGKSHIGLGTYRAGAYAESGGFNSGVDIREEIDLSRRIRKVINRREDVGHTARKREAVLNALDDPRRAAAALMAGRPITRIYDTWTNDAVRNVSLEDVLNQPVPPEAQLNPENVQKQVQAVYDFYFRHILASQERTRKSRAAQVRYAQSKAENYLKRSLGFLGIDDYKLSYNGNLAADYDKSNHEIGRNLRVMIGSIHNLEKLTQAYPQRKRAPWIAGKETEAEIDVDTSEKYFKMVNEGLRGSSRRAESFAIQPDALAEVFGREGMVFNGAVLQDAQVSYANNRITVTGTLQYRGKQIPVRRMVLGRERINEDISVMELDLDRTGLSFQERALVMIEKRRVRSQIQQRMHGALNAQIDEDNANDAWRADEIRLGNEIRVDYRRPAIPLGTAPGGAKANTDPNPPPAADTRATRPPTPTGPPRPRPVNTPRRIEGQTVRYERFEGNMPTITMVDDDRTPGLRFGTEEVGQAELHKLDAIDKRAILQRTVINGDSFPAEGDGILYALRPKDLYDAGLSPEYKVNIDGVQMMLSTPYELNSGRVAFVAYVKDENNKYRARSYYLSNSQGVWRYLPGYTLKEGTNNLSWYDKGHSEQSINAPVALQQAFNAVLQSKDPILPPGNSDFYFAGTSRSLDHAHERTYTHEVSAEPKSIPGDFELPYGKQYEGGKYRKIRPEDIAFDDAQNAPDFSKAPILTWEQKTNQYGDVEMEVYESADGKYNYMFCRDKKGRVWIGSIEDKSDITSIGVRKHWINGGDLMTPAYEYTSQIGANVFANWDDQDGNYVDMYENYLSRIPVIKAYNEAREARLTGRPVEPANLGKTANS